MSHPTKPVVANAHTEMAIRYKTSVINPDGSVAKANPWKKNLILDQGLNLLATLGSTFAWTTAVVGTGTTPVKRDSASVTFSRSGTTVTASASFFGSGDVGRLLKFDSGEEVYINAYTDDTHVETVTSGTIASAQGTVWYVNQTGLTTEAKRTSVFRTEAGDNSTTFDGTDTFTHQRTFQFSAESGGVTYTEIGWSYTPTAGGNLFGRDLIPGGGDVLLTGQQLQVVVQMTTKISPVTPLSVSNVGTGFNSAGTLMLESLSMCVNNVATSGDPSIYPPGLSFRTVVLEAATNVPVSVACICLMADWTQQSSPSAAVVSGGSPASAPGGIALSSLGYTNGTFRLDYTGTIPLAGANGTIHGFNFQSAVFSELNLTLKLTTPLVKDNAHTLTVTYRKSWSRVLVN